MRILLASALLALTASCAWPPPPTQAAAPGAPAAPVPLAPPPATPSPPPVVAAAAPGGAPAAATVDYRPIPLIWLQMFNAPAGPPPGRLTLSNIRFDRTRVETVITSGPSCAIQHGSVTSDFMLPLNATRVITTPPGTDICWRRALPAEATQGAAAAPAWSGWNRAFTSTGHSIDARL